RVADLLGDRARGLEALERLVDGADPERHQSEALERLALVRPAAEGLRELELLGEGLDRLAVLAAVLADRAELADRRHAQPRVVELRRQIDALLEGRFGALPIAALELARTLEEELQRSRAIRGGREAVVGPAGVLLGLVGVAVLELDPREPRQRVGL